MLDLEFSKRVRTLPDKFQQITSKRNLLGWDNTFADRLWSQNKT